MNFYAVIVIFLLTELTTQLSNSMLNTKCDILNLKMQKMSKTLTMVTSSLSCDVIKLLFHFSTIYKKDYMYAKIQTSLTLRTGFTIKYFRLNTQKM